MSMIPRSSRITLKSARAKKGPARCWCFEKNTRCLDIQLGKRLTWSNRIVGCCTTIRMATWSFGMDRFSNVVRNKRMTAKMLVEPVYCCTGGHITACYSAHDNDILLTLRRLGPRSDHDKSSHHPLRTAHFTTFCVVSHSCMVAEQLKLVLVNEW